MERFEITNYGRIEHVMYKGLPHVFPKGETQRTDDEELADLAGAFPYIEVIEEKTPLEEMTKKELLDELATKGISKTTGLSKAGLIEALRKGVDKLLNRGESTP